MGERVKNSCLWQVFSKRTGERQLGPVPTGYPGFPGHHDKPKKIYLNNLYDPLAQLVEHMTFNHGVPGSNPGWVTKKYADVAKLADALDLGSSGRPWGFKSLHPHQNEGVSPSGKAQDFDSCTRRFKSCHPCHIFSPKWDYFL